MNKIFKPQWIIICTIIPVLIVIAFHFWEFQIIKSLLNEESLIFWKQLALGIGIFALLNIGYCLYLILKKETISVIYSILLLITSIIFIYIYNDNDQILIPRNIPRWMISNHLVLYTFLMPSIAFSIGQLVVSSITGVSEKISNGIIIIIGIPFIWYIVSEIIKRFTDLKFDDNYKPMIITLIILSLLTFYFFLVRTFLIYIQNRTKSEKQYFHVLNIIIALVLPIIGLLVNNGLLFDLTRIDHGIFGNFHNPWVYGLTILNGILICIPNPSHFKARLTLFVLRSITLSFTLYFFLVFLPFLPFSIFAIIVIGAGLLMLSPLVLFILHINIVIEDISFLKSKLTKAKILLLLAGGFLMIPTVLTVQFYSYKLNLNSTLEYVYSPNYEKEYTIDKNELKETISNIKQNKSGLSRGILTDGLPYISDYFNWIVLDNFTLSNTKINKIETLFFGKSEVRKSRPEFNRSHDVHITNLKNTSVYDAKQKAWKSWIHIDMTNASKNQRREFTSTLQLPEGAWISDYYLNIGDRKEMGILAEKKAAMWVYAQILPSPRDPGILFYQDDNTIAFRVYPFDSNEVRTTGIEIVHKEPFTFTMSDKSIVLGDTVFHSVSNSNTNDKVVYVSSKQKHNLKKIDRTPYFHFIIDASKKDNIINYTDRMQTLLDDNKYAHLTKNARVSIVNHNIKTFNVDDNWSEYLSVIDSTEGFFVKRAIEKVYFNTYTKSSKTYPVIVIISEDYEPNHLSNTINQWKFANPEQIPVYYTSNNRHLVPNILDGNTLKSNFILLLDSVEQTSVLEYKTADNAIHYLPNNTKASLVLLDEKFTISTAEIKEKNWNSGLVLAGKTRSHILHPEISDSEWFDMVKYSFKSKIMTPYTSYLALENEAQKAILKRKQKQFLNSNKSLDLGEETLQMSEPNFYIILLLLSLFVIFKYRKRIWGSFS